MPKQYEKRDSEFEAWYGISVLTDVATIKVGMQAAFNAGWSARKYEEYKVRAAIDNVPIV